MTIFRCFEISIKSNSITSFCGRNSFIFFDEWFRFVSLQLKTTFHRIGIGKSWRMIPPFFFSTVSSSTNRIWARESHIIWNKKWKTKISFLTHMHFSSWFGFRSHFSYYIPLKILWSHRFVTKITNLLFASSSIYKNFVYFLKIKILSRTYAIKENFYLFNLNWIIFLFFFLNYFSWFNFLYAVVHDTRFVHLLRIFRFWLVGL